MQHKKHTASSRVVALGATLLVVFGAMGGALAKGSMDTSGMFGGDRGMNQGPNDFGPGPMGDPFKQITRGLNANSLADKIEQLSEICTSLDVEMTCDTSAFDADAEKLQEYNDKMEELGSEVEDAILDDDMDKVKEIKKEFLSIKRDQKKIATSVLKSFKATIKTLSKDYKAALKAERAAEKAERDADMKEQKEEMQSQREEMKKQQEMNREGNQRPSGDDFGRGKNDGNQNFNDRRGDQNQNFNDRRGDQNQGGGSMYCMSLSRQSTPDECNAADAAQGFNGDRRDPPPQNGERRDPPPQDGERRDPPPQNGERRDPPPPQDGDRRDPPPPVN